MLVTWLKIGECENIIKAKESGGEEEGGGAEREGRR